MGENNHETRGSLYCTDPSSGCHLPLQKKYKARIKEDCEQNCETKGVSKNVVSVQRLGSRFSKIHHLSCL